MPVSRRKKLPTPGKAPTYPDVPVLAKSPGEMDMTPGFYQGRQTGIKSGRQAPRDALRPSRSDIVDAAHGIKSQGSIDPNHGQLFDTRQMPVVSQSELVRRGGGPAPDPAANHKGFMPNLDTHKQKVAAIRHLGESRDRTGATRSFDITRGTKKKPAKNFQKAYSPVAETMADRADYLSRPGGNNDWYASRVTHQANDFGIPGRGTSGIHVDPQQGPPDPTPPQGMKHPDGYNPRLTHGVRDRYSSDRFAAGVPQEGHLAQGEAGRLIGNVAAAQGVSHGRAARSVAITSPRTRWSAVSNAGLSYPNIESANNVMTNVKALGPDPSALRAEKAGRQSEGRSLDSMKAKAGVEFARGEPTAPIPIKSKVSIKVPNFEQSIHLDSPSKAVQAQAARSWTADVHDTSVAGGDEQLLKQVGGYEIQAMTGRRASLKAGELPPRGQSKMWSHRLGEVAAEALPGDGLFVSGRKGRLMVNPAANADIRVSRAHNADLRSPTAMKHGLEF